ncbi:MAG: hypothetical protein KC609_24330, partial [Myxococcales bacterium]|nr:hypothetical protein [Myxococcales bacterium]
MNIVASASPFDGPCEDTGDCRNAVRSASSGADGPLVLKNAVASAGASCWSCPMAGMKPVGSNARLSLEFTGLIAGGAAGHLRLVSMNAVAS